MRRVLVTGARGFLGRHVAALLGRESGVSVLAATRDTAPAELARLAGEADAVIHLAGVNRPEREEEFTSGNVDLTRALTHALRAAGRGATLVLSSSARAGEESAYGRSKAAAETLVREYAARTGARAAIFRLPNVFGKWSRPFYNSAVATFCHSIARDLPVDVHDPSRLVRLVYAEDVARALIAAALDPTVAPGARDAEAGPVHERTLGEIVELLRQFRAMRIALRVPDLSDEFTRKLYGTYVGFIEPADAAYALQRHTDERGSLAELLKSPAFGQVFVSRTRPGITRGNHFHHTKTEKFVVVEGEAVIRMRPADGGPVTEIPVHGADFTVVDIPTGYTHAITNVGSGELVTLFWASEIFDRERPDTYALDVEPTA